MTYPVALVLVLRSITFRLLHSFCSGSQNAALSLQCACLLPNFHVSLKGSALVGSEPVHEDAEADTSSHADRQR